jgi:protein-L-isoaspartate(D-aspartate) O-methyltransferase
MVERQIRQRGVADTRVLTAMETIPRERFVPPGARSQAYDDVPLAIGFNQTISQPYIVAYMTEVLDVRDSHRVLEIGTGSAYQAAVLGKLAREVWTIEIVPELAASASDLLRGLGLNNVHVRLGDGYSGWPEQAPFDRIMATAAPDEIPAPLIEQLAVGGRLVIPVGSQGGPQWMMVVERSSNGVVQNRTIPVQFVPLTRDRKQSG